MAYFQQQAWNAANANALGQYQGFLSSSATSATGYLGFSSQTVPNPAYTTYTFTTNGITNPATGTWIHYNLQGQQIAWPQPTMQWTATMANQINIPGMGISNWVDVPETPEARAVREKWESIRMVANKRADKLLVSLLTTRQKKMWMAMGLLFIPSAVQPGVVFEVRRRTDLIRVYRNGVPECDLCVHEQEGLPLSDRVIQWKFLLECDEETILKAANRHVIAPEHRKALKPELLAFAKVA